MRFEFNSSGISGLALEAQPKRHVIYDGKYQIRTSFDAACARCQCARAPLSTRRRSFKHPSQPGPLGTARAPPPPLYLEKSSEYDTVSTPLSFCFGKRNRRR